MGGQEDLFAEMLGMGREPDRRVSAHLPPMAPEPQIDELEVQRLVVEEIAADKAALEADKAELEAYKTKLEADKAALEADKAKLEADKAALEAKVLQIETEKQELSRQLEEAKREKSELEERLVEARGGLDELEEKLARMGRSLAAARRAATVHRDASVSGCP